ncbi:MAG TPA: hypothetical protein ACYCDB_00935 [Candidatus Azoamicus sp.]
MKKIFIFVFVFYILCFFLSFADEKNPVYFLEKIIEESRPALMSKNDDFLEKTMEKYIDFERNGYVDCWKNYLVIYRLI